MHGTYADNTSGTDNFEGFWKRLTDLMDEATRKGHTFTFVGTTGTQNSGSTASMIDLKNHTMPLEKILATQAEAVSALAAGKRLATNVFAREGLL